MKQGSITQFGRFCRKLKIENGKPLKLEAFQRAMLKDYFRGATETVIVIPKKNGKTTLMAALGLFHLEAVPGAEVVMGASSRDQARIIFEQASGLARRSELPYTLRWREIRHNGGRMRALAADADTGDGVIPTLALVDELHVHRNGRLYGVFRDGLVGRGGQMITISTAGWDMDSPLGILRKKAHEMETFRREGAHNHATSPDGSFVMHEWGLNDSDDLNDIELVKTANPASWHTLEALRRRHDSPSTTPAQWARFACGVWTAGEKPWLRPEQWDGLERDEIADGEDVWIGVDVAREGPTGIAVVARRGDRIAVRGVLLNPPPGGLLPLEHVERVLVDLSERYRVQEINYDPANFLRSAELLSERGLITEDIPRRAERLSIASTTLYRLIDSGELRHDGSPTLRAQVLAGKTKESERGWRLVKDRDNHALIALAMTAHRATEVPSEAPMFVSLG